MKRIAVFASGSGTNAENLINHFLMSKRASVDLVLTENSSAYVIERAKKLAVPTLIFTMQNLQSGAITRALNKLEIDYIVLAGFLKLLPKNLLEAFPQKIINIHPSLLPKYGGKGMYGSNVHRAVLSAGDSESGISIHLVNSKYDDGKILFQARCPVLADDTPEALAQRVHALEYEHYPKVVESYISSL